MINLRYALLVPLTTVIVSLSLLFFKGLNLGVDFTGGISAEVSFPQPLSVDALSNALDIPIAQVTQYGSRSEHLIRLPQSYSLTESQLANKLQASSDPIIKAFTIKKFDHVGSEFSSVMADQGMTALLVALVFICLYITYRFELTLALASVFALLHDPIIILGFFSFFQWSFDLGTLAGILAVLGYSLNDTIVVFDRVRENFNLYPQEQPFTLVKLSILQTLSRTIITSLLTFFVVLSLLIVGTKSLQGFSLSLAIGIIFGTYSSIFVAGPLALIFGLKHENLISEPSESGSEVVDFNRIKGFS